MLLLWIGLAVLVVAAIPYALYLVGFRIASPSGSPARKDDTVEPVSIVLPTYNESDIVRNTLERLCSLEYPADELEIVVVDSSDDDTATVVRDFFEGKEHPESRLIEETDRGGVARAVNRGVDAASHDVIFRTDCDSRLHEDAITHAVANLQDPSVGAVTGRQKEVLGDSDVEESYRDMQARNQALESHLDSTFIVHGPCFAFRKEYFAPIEEDSLADDTEIAIGVRKRGKRVLMDPAMQFTEVGVSDIRDRRERKDRRAMGLLQLLDRNRDIFGGYGLYGWIVVPFNWWFLSVSPWLSVGGAALSLLGLLTTVPVLGGAVAAAFLGFVMLGQRDRLGPLQAPYAVFDSHLSLVIARVRLRRGDEDGTWSIDTSSRELLR
ncbi:glycosyltransferase [Halobiforma nitratireducens]|uniref:Glycosyl transferase family protein n=1 Tax=Halobiforma nitratireducens JCM 10879 TaxID=1227454 RepID=M0LT96_9EURY|nr:glycosyltransferase [Halobiforma nitratireducens]EMA35335.1 glycosyl transferase family protein [Halobiforma nitratireducens JCM 10879]